MNACSSCQEESFLSRLSAVMKKLSKPQIVFMDCDGVIFDSNELKNNAFAQSVAGYPAKSTALFDAHVRAQGGVSRYEKFDHFFRTIHPVNDPKAEIAKALEHFSRRSKEVYAMLEPIPEALHFAQLMGRGSVYVVSGSDQEELRGVFSAHGIRDCFVDVLGSPTKKPAHFKAVLKQRRISAEHALMVGDGLADFQAAKALGMPFIFLERFSDWSNAKDVLVGQADVYIAENWQKVLELLEDLPGGLEGG